MIIGRDLGNFLKTFFSRGPAQAFLLQDESGDLEPLFLSYLACEKKSFCKKCSGCQAEITLDLMRFEDEALKIEDAREIQRKASQSSFLGAKIFLLKNSYIAPEAQATLLKTMEEPHPDTYFVLSKVPVEALSRPLLSRLTVLRRVEDRPRVAKNFKLELEDVQKLPQERLEVEKIFRKLEIWADEKSRNLTAAHLGMLVSFIEDLYETKLRFFEKTCPPKMLLEHLAISKFYLES